ncbi:hypothetical protein [Streptomyces eurythermus]|uniref:hypothetical protein n=1 Tax=Streptomyces eurythermus TaxID=42237 RepID=UPI0036FEF8D1
MTSSEQQLTPAEIRLAQYGQRTSTWSTASYTGGTEKALNEIALELKAEVDRLRDALDKEEHRHGETIRDRDRFHDMADKLAYAVAPAEVIGEHSSMNCPWENALDLITPMAEDDRLRQQITTLTTLAERWEQMAEHGDVAIGTFDGPAAATLDAEVGERGRTYRKAATDLRDVLRTGRVSHDLMTDAELSAPATAASVAPAPAGADEHGLQTQPAEAVRG